MVFTAFVGYGVVRRALLCTLVDPTLRGVVLSGPVGTGKSALLASFAEFTQRCVDPEIPFVRLPAGVDDDRLIGGIDIDTAFTSGERRLAPGLLADADGGYLIVDDLPLLADSATSAIGSALERNELLCERDGFSAILPARFQLLATAVASEREFPFWLADRVAFLLARERRLPQEGTEALLAAHERERNTPEEERKRHEKSELQLAERVSTARILYPMVNIGTLLLTTLVEKGVELGVSGNRADIFAAKAARAHAALRGSREIEEADIEFAIATVLIPRSANIPDAETDAPDAEEEPTPPEASEEEHEEERKTPPSQQSRSAEGSDAEEQEHQEMESPSSEDDSNREREEEEELLGTDDFTGDLPELTSFLPSRESQRGGSGGDTSGWARGIHIRSLQRDPRGKRIALGATLRAAAPHQHERRLKAGDGSRVLIRKEDLRVKRFSRRAGTLFIFCVDASGSMAFNRMREAKGAVTRLLQEAYVNRDSVALIAFRGAESELLLPPTTSVERAKRSLDILPTGGGTPLASALMKALAVAASERRRGNKRSLVVLLTDGRANVPLADNAAGMIMEARRRHVRAELERIASAYLREGVHALVIDTRETWGAATDAVRLATMLNARYYYLPRFDARELATLVKQTGAAERAKR